MSWGGTGAMAGTTMCGLVTEMLVALLLCVPVSFFFLGGGAIFGGSSMKQANGPGKVL